MKEITSKQNKILKLFNSMYSRGVTRWKTIKESIDNDDVNFELLKELTNKDIKELTKKELKDVKNHVYCELDILQNEENPDDGKIAEIINITNYLDNYQIKGLGLKIMTPKKNVITFTYIISTNKCR